MKRLFTLIFAALLATSAFAGCNASATTTSSQTPASSATVSVEETKKDDAQTQTPKYVFLFIGDGMSYPQIQITSNYLGALDEKDDILSGGKALNFMNFPVAGSATTYDSTSFCPDSASTATSISTGKKTYSGMINVDEKNTTKYETIAEKVKKQLGYKVGIISSVNINHATPAAFYCHQESRNNYYEIGQELIASDFDYFAGGGLKKTTGDKKENPQEDLYELAQKAGYKVSKTQADSEKMTAADGKMILIDEHLQDSSAMKYDMDRADGEWGLKDYVKKGIDVLDNDKGFFMMVEGGKIDWACHGNDAAATINDTLALQDSVQEAIDFAKKHPTETLILVTGDHETGGLTIGFAGTNYDTFLSNISNQKISFTNFDMNFVAKYKENKTSFDDVMKDVEEQFGLVTEADKDKAKDEKLVLNEYEVGLLKDAYEITMKGGFAQGEQTQEQYIKYGGYEPLTVTITHLLNNKSGVNFASYSHTGVPVAVLAQGAGQDEFQGYYDNTEIFSKLSKLLQVK